MHYTAYIFITITCFFLKTAYAGGAEREQHVTHPALGPGRVFVWVTWLALCSISTKINPCALLKWLHSSLYLREDASLPSAAVTPAHSAQAVQLWPTKSSRLGTRRSRAAITFTARSRTAIITARQAAYVICRALDRTGTSCVRVLGTSTLGEAGCWNRDIVMSFHLSLQLSTLNAVWLLSLKTQQW